MSDDLLRALSALIPKADIALIAEQRWNSLSFTGKQVSFTLTLAGEDRAIVAGKFADRLSEQIFDFPDHLVADIAVTEAIDDENQTRLVIDALLLDD